MDAALVSCELPYAIGGPFVAVESARSLALRTYGLVEPGLDPAFDRFARLAVSSTRVASCVLAFGDDPSALIKGYSGPVEASSLDALPPRAFYAALLEGSHVTAASGEVAGAVIRSPNGVPIGAVCVRAPVARTWPYHLLDTLADVA